MSRARSRVATLPVTRGNMKFLETTLKQLGFDAPRIAAAVRQWRRAIEQASRFAQLLSEVHDRRLRGVSGALELEIVYDEHSRMLEYTSRGGPQLPVSVRPKSALSAKQHRHELATMNVQWIGVPEGKVDPVVSLSPDAASLTSRAAGGDPGALGELGVSSVKVYAFPIAFVRASTSRDPVTGLVTRVEVPALAAASPSFDAFSFLNAMRLAGDLPLKSENDVRRFMMALAAPLLRAEMPGLLGVYWVVGPSGTGKELVLVAIKEVWKAVATLASRESFELKDGGGGEDQKSFAANRRAVYVHFREAGKRGIQAVEDFIRLTGAARVPARGLYEQAGEIDNSFVYLADSAESVPDRREISRRVVPINAVAVPGGTDGRGLLKRVRAVAPLIIASLKQQIEAAGIEALDIRSADGRPLAVAFLAKLLGASLDTVQGESLDDIFRALLLFISTPYLLRSAERVLTNGPAFASKHTAFSPSFFVETMMKHAGFQELFTQIRHGKYLFERINRELADPGLVGDGADYAVVLLDGVEYGLRFFGTRRDAMTFFPVVSTMGPAPSPADAGSIPRPLRVT